MGPNFKNLIEELKNVRTIDLACVTANVLEKIFWAVLGILGIAWAFYFIPGNVEVWMTNPAIVTQGDFDLSQIKYPALTIKPSGITKYGISERLGNYIKPNKLPSALREVRNMLLKCATIENQEDITRSDGIHFSEFSKQCIYNFMPTKDDKELCKVSEYSGTFLETQTETVNSSSSLWDLFYFIVKARINQLKSFIKMSGKISGIYLIQTLEPTRFSKTYQSIQTSQ